MSAWQYILASLRQYRRIHVAVALGVAVATAVLTGALLVGDSLRGSLRDLTLQRLGHIDTIVLAGQPFREQLAAELAKSDGFRRSFTAAEPALILGGSLQAGSGAAAHRATGITVVGCRPAFWSLGKGGPTRPLAEDEVALTASVARELGVDVGGNVLLRVPASTTIPADSTLGEKSDTIRGRSFRVAALLPATGLARFGIAPNQQLPRNVFASLGSIQRLLEVPGKANAMLIASEDAAGATSADARQELAAALRPTLADFGLSLAGVGRPEGAFQISAEQLVLPDEVVRAARQAWGNQGLQPVATYLANTISTGQGNERRSIPYSTICGVDSRPELGPLFDKHGQPTVLGDDEIALNRWAADDLGAKLGDEIAVTYYEPESTHGRLREHDPPVRFTLKAIVELETAEGKPTLAANPRLAPELPGVTDQKSIHDWELPFELVETIRPKDEEYWKRYRTTPKAFVSLATAERLWASRWGSVSLLRGVASGVMDGEDAARQPAEAAHREARRQLERAIRPSALGMSMLAVKERGLAASAGTTPFEGLFLGFSFFLIAAAVMLVALLFRLGIEQRASEIGTLAAMGIDRRRITRWLTVEGAMVAAGGSIWGVALGVLYAWMMVFGLRTWWLAAVSTPFINLHVGAASLLIGGFVGLVVSWWVIGRSVGRLARQPVTRLLAGIPNGAVASFSQTARRSESWLNGRWSGLFSWSTMRVLVGAIVVVLCGAGFFSRGETQAGVFFGCGAAMLMLMLGEIRNRLQHSGRVIQAEVSFGLGRLARLNLTRNPGRSVLTIGLVATSSFLILAVSAFRLDTGEGGTGRFDLVASSDLPIHFDLGTPAGRSELGFSAEAEARLDTCGVFSFRVEQGENASCLNLYQPTQPTVLGVPGAFESRQGFAWAASEKAFGENPWMALDSRNAKLGNDEAGRPIVPVVLDASTAIYSLHLKGLGSRYMIRDAGGNAVTLQVVGLLRNSVLQGRLLVGEREFLQMFPDAAGYRFFLIETHADKNKDYDEVARVAASLESTLSDEGFDAVEAREQLAEYLAVQNTYLSTFQSLGALGLLLGTLGLAVVQLRSVLERRGELALLRAGGFSARRLVRLVVLENFGLLAGGLTLGCIAAVVALIPQWMPQSAGVPWLSLGMLLATIAIVGLLAGWLATRSVLRAPIVGALRGD
ncbi:MAG: ABC transporter permease [Pirellulales bacterium]|nr:ABC transporter permease [Pirellulales bacterium]